MTDSSNRRIAFVTGASRGIGKQAALALARKGFDVVISARTLHDGEKHERGAYQSDTRPVSGSLMTTAREIEAIGQQALPIQLDLLDPDSIQRAFDQTLSSWGHIDLLVNNGIYQGPGTMAPVMELTAQDMQKIYQGNLFSQLLLVQLCLAQMIERDSGCIINMVSQAGMMDPPAIAGKGGWGFAYASSKAAFIRMIGVLKVEHADNNIQFYNIEPGFIVTEIMIEKKMVDEHAARFGGAPPTVPAAVIAWLATEPNAKSLHGETIAAQAHCLKHNLVPEWQPRKP